MSNQLAAKLASFKNIVCKECAICSKDNNPSFCYLFMLNDKKKFLEYVVRTGKIEEKSKLIDKKFLRSAAGFFELVCNKKACPNYRVVKCEKLEQKVLCYATWCSGYKQAPMVASTLLTRRKEVLLNIRYKNLINRAWASLGKNKKKQLKKEVKAVAKKIRKHFPTTDVIVQAEVFPITTTIFYDDDEEWIKHINEVLSK